MARRRWQQQWAPYVSVGQRRAQARQQAEALRQQGLDAQPVGPLKGRAIAATFWGKGWCSHLEKFSDYANRLPRGRSYVRHGSVCHLAIEAGQVRSLVSGSDLYEVEVTIQTMPQGKWDYIRQSCTGQIASLLELLQGRLSDEVMAVVTDREDGLFPLPGEMTFTCSCPDWAVMCKHVAATLYGVGARLDESPELLFALRGVDHGELIGGEAVAAATAAGRKANRRRAFKGDVAELFGVEAEADETAPRQSTTRKKAAKKKPQKKAIRAKRHEPSRRKAPATAGGATVEDLLDRLTGRLVERLVTASGLTRQHFAKAIGVSPGALTRWIQGGDAPLRLYAKSRRAWASVLAAGRAADEDPIGRAVATVLREEEGTKSKKAAKRTKRSPAKGRADKGKKRQKKGKKSPENQAYTGATLAGLRGRLGLSVAAFARRVGVTAGAIRRAEKKDGALRFRKSTAQQLRELEREAPGKGER